MKEFKCFKIWYKILGIFSVALLFIGLIVESYFNTAAGAILIILSLSILVSLTLNTVIYFSEELKEKQDEEE